MENYCWWTVPFPSYWTTWTSKRSGMYSEASPKQYLKHFLTLSVTKPHIRCTGRISRIQSDWISTSRRQPTWNLVVTAESPDLGASSIPADHGGGCHSRNTLVSWQGHLGGGCRWLVMPSYACLLCCCLQAICSVFGCIYIATPSENLPPGVLTSSSLSCTPQEWEQVCNSTALPVCLGQGDTRHLQPLHSSPVTLAVDQGRGCGKKELKFELCPEWLDVP